MPWVPEAERLQVEPLVEGFWRVRVNFGFKDEPDVPRALRLCTRAGLLIDESALSYFLSDGESCIAEEVIAKIDTEGVEATSPLEALGLESLDRSHPQLPHPTV